MDLENLPRHIACVMDGNGRWAAQRGLARTDGHVAGEEALAATLQAALDVGIEWLTVYAFSTENWSRPPQEVDFLMQFNRDRLEKRSQELHEQGVRVLFAGRTGPPVPPDLSERMERTMELTKSNDRMTFTVAFNYGGRAEIIDAARALVDSGVSAERIDEALIRSHLYVPDMPDVDLMIRTSNEFRTSNFLMWEAAYAELYFTETLWPDFREEQLYDAIREYQRRHRRFGGLG